MDAGKPVLNTLEPHETRPIACACRETGMMRSKSMILIRFITILYLLSFLLRNARIVLTRASSIVPVKNAECITSLETSGFESEEISKYMKTTRSIAANAANAMTMGLFFMIIVLLCLMSQI